MHCTVSAAHSCTTSHRVKCEWRAAYCRFAVNLKCKAENAVCCCCRNPIVRRTNNIGLHNIPMNCPNAISTSLPLTSSLLWLGWNEPKTICVNPIIYFVFVTQYMTIVHRKAATKEYGKRNSCHWRKAIWAGTPSTIVRRLYSCLYFVG